ETNGAGRSTARPVLHAQGYGANGGDVDEVFLHFQRQMSKYLETQREVMLAYLKHDPAALTAVADESAGWDGDAPAATGRDGPETGVPVRQEVADDIPVNGANGYEAGASVEEAKTDALRAPLSLEQITHALLQIVSERTGYPP